MRFFGVPASHPSIYTPSLPRVLADLQKQRGLTLDASDPPNTASLGTSWPEMESTLRKREKTVRSTSLMAPNNSPSAHASISMVQPFTANRAPPSIWMSRYPYWRPSSPTKHGRTMGYESYWQVKISTCIHAQPDWTRGMALLSNRSKSSMRTVPARSCTY